MKYIEFKKTLREKNLKNLYLFCGEEEFLIESCTELMKKQLIDKDCEDFNYFSFNDQTANIEAIANALEGYPVLSEHKMIVLREIGLFKTMADAEKDNWCEIFADIPDYACLVIWEKDIDKRSKIYKKIASCGEIVEFPYATAADLKGWLARILLKNEKTIENDAMEHLILLAGPSMTRLKNELSKVEALVGERGTISKKDVEAVVARPLSDKVFDLCDALLEGKVKEVFAILEDLKSLRESGIKILSILSSGFSDSLRACFISKEGMPYGEMVKAMNMPGRDFVAKKYLNNAKRRNPNVLRQAISLCREADSDIKLGKCAEWDALEMVILKVLGKGK